MYLNKDLKINTEITEKETKQSATTEMLGKVDFIKLNECMRAIFKWQIVVTIVATGMHTTTIGCLSLCLSPVTDRRTGCTSPFASWQLG